MEAIDVVFKGKSAQLLINNKVLLKSESKTITIEQSELLGACKTSEDTIDILSFAENKFSRFSLSSHTPDDLVSQIQHLSFPDLRKNTEKKHFLVFLNPISGRGQALIKWKLVSGMFDGCWVTVHQTQYRGHAHDIVKDSDLSDIDGLISVSGDGLVHELLNGLCKNPKHLSTPIGIIPAGSGNALAQYISRPTISLSHCASLCIKGKTQSLDINEISFADNSTVFSFLSISWGYLAEVDIESDYFRCCGIIRYTLYGAWKLLRLQRPSGEFHCEKYSHTGPFTYFIVCNLPFIGENMNVAPLAIPNDGLNDFLIMKNASRLDLTKVLLHQDSGSHLSCRNLDYFHCTDFTLTPNGGFFSIDGDFYPAQSIAVRLLRSHINIFSS